MTNSKAPRSLSMSSSSAQAFPTLHGHQTREAGMNSFLISRRTRRSGPWWEIVIPVAPAISVAPLFLLVRAIEQLVAHVSRPAGNSRVPKTLRRALQACAEHPPERAFSRSVWDEAAGVWRASTQDRTRIQARVLVSGMGALHVPRYPDIEGIGRFKGPAFIPQLGITAWTWTGKPSRSLELALAPSNCPQIAPRWETPSFSAHSGLDPAAARFAFSEKWKRRFRRMPLTRWALRQYISGARSFVCSGFWAMNRFERRLRRLRSAISRAGLRTPSCARR